MDNFNTVRLVPALRVRWPEPGHYYELDGHFKLCVAVNFSTGWATFWGPECQNQYVRLARFGELTEYNLEAVSLEAHDAQVLGCMA